MPTPIRFALVLIAAAAASACSRAPAPASPVPADARAGASFEAAIVDRPISFSTSRIEGTRAYIRDHYGLDAADIAITPRMIVLHWTAIDDLEGSFRAFDPETLRGSRPDLGAEADVNVSIQFLVGKDGTVYRLMPETWMARHVIGLNHSAIGVENVGTGTREGHTLTDAQVAANIALVRYLARKYPTIEYLIGHHEYLAFEGHPLWLERDPDYRTSKIDPGNAFMAAVRAGVADLGLRQPPTALERATQLLMVTTPGWDATTGELRRFVRDRVGAPWRADGAAVPIVVGRSGLAWGVGFDSLATAGAETAGPRKREGDGRSPAGVFPLGTAFGFAPADSAATGLPYLRLVASTECVDDTGSAHYNRVVDRAAVGEADWASAERMRQIPLYRRGVVVDYNPGPVSGRGSCIFLHIWDGPASTTSGCTALDAGELSGLVAWLDADARPVLVQLPAAVHAEVRDDWGLPSLDR